MVSFNNLSESVAEKGRAAFESAAGDALQDDDSGEQTDDETTGGGDVLAVLALAAVAWEYYTDDSDSGSLW